MYKTYMEDLEKDLFGLEPDEEELLTIYDNLKTQIIITQKKRIYKAIDEIRKRHKSNAFASKICEEIEKYYQWQE